MGSRGQVEGSLECPVCGESITYRGWHDDGQYFGPPENCYPAESELEVEFHDGCKLTNDQEDALESAAYNGEGVVSERDLKAEYMADREWEIGDY